MIPHCFLPSVLLSSSFFFWPWVAVSSISARLCSPLCSLRLWSRDSFAAFMGPCFLFRPRNPFSLSTCGLLRFFLFSAPSSCGSFLVGLGLVLAFRHYCLLVLFFGPVLVSLFFSLLRVVSPSSGPQAVSSPLSPVRPCLSLELQVASSFFPLRIALSGPESPSSCLLDFHVCLVEHRKKSHGDKSHNRRERAKRERECMLEKELLTSRNISRRTERLQAGGPGEARTSRLRTCLDGEEKHGQLAESPLR